MSTKMSPVTVFVNEGAGVSVTGILDATSAPEVNRVVTDFLTLGDICDLDVLTLDLSTVTMCDQSAVDVVRHAQAACAKAAVALRVIPSDAVRYAMCPRP
jgi:anti-anti-sigma regulatory factor